MTFQQSALVSSAIDPDVSAAIVIFDRLKPLKEALGIADLSDGELQVFAMVCHHTGLDPFTKQIYAIKRRGKVTHQTGIDGYRSTAERMTGQYAGSDETTFEACECDELPKGHPKIARTVVHRLLPNGHMVDQVGIARWHELVPSGDEAFMWRKMPHNQLSKCSEANGLRKAFPRVLGGVYIEEEMQQADTVEGAATVLPTAAERIAARRQAAELPSVDADAERAASQGVGMSRQDFIAAIERAGISTDIAAARAKALFGTPHNLTDEQRADLLLDLTNPEAPSIPMFDSETEEELDRAAMA